MKSRTKTHRPTAHQQATYIWFDNGYLMIDPIKSQYNVVFEVPPIKNIVFTAAGCRGLNYIGAVQAFSEATVDCESKTTLLEQEDFSFSGASAGAIIGSFAACGMRPHELQTRLGSIDLEELLGPGWQPAQFMPPIQRSGKPLYELLRTAHADSITLRLQELMQVSTFDSSTLRHFVTQQENLSLIHQAELNKLADELAKRKHDDHPIITFAMLDALHHLNPIIFKKLYVVAVCRETGAAYYFSVATAPHLEIARAVHASAAIPAILKSVKIAKKHLLLYRDKPEIPEYVHMVDGGYFDASPYSVFDSAKEKQVGYNVGGYNQNLQTLILMPDDTKAADYEYDLEQVLKMSLNTPTIHSHGPSFPVETTPITMHEESAVHTTTRYAQSPLVNYRDYAADELAPPSFLDDFISNRIPRWFGLVKSNIVYTEKRERDLQLIRRQFSQRNIPIRSGIKTLQTKEAKQHADHIIAYAKQLTLEYLKNHQRECAYFSYRSLSDLMKYLPEDKYQYLIQHREYYPFLDEFDLIKINASRERHKALPVSLWPRFNNFIQDFYRVSDELKLPAQLLGPLQIHFEIISTDDSPNDDVKMLRVLSTLFDYYPALRLIEEGKAFLNFFSKHFNRYLNMMNAKMHFSLPDIDENSLMSEPLRAAHYHLQQFHVVYQRIVFLLKQTKSSLINPEDEHKRTFLQTILNDIQDLAVLYLDGPNRLKRLEAYLLISYYKVIYYKGASDSRLAAALKKIIYSSRLLNLSYHYGIHLPDHIKKIPNFCLSQQEDTQLLDSLRYHKLHDFIRRMDNIMYDAERISAHYFTFSLFDKNQLLFTNFYSDKKATIYRAIVKTMLVSPYEKDQFYGKKLNEYITPLDLQNDQEKTPSLFYASSLLTRLMWVQPHQHEQGIYNHLLVTIKDFICHYEDESHDPNFFIHELTDCFKVLYALDLNAGFSTFFHGHGTLYLMIKHFMKENFQMDIVTEKKTHEISLHMKI